MLRSFRARFGVKKRGGGRFGFAHTASTTAPASAPHLSQLSSPRGRARRPPRARAYIFTFYVPSVDRPYHGEFKTPLTSYVFYMVFYFFFLDCRYTLGCQGWREPRPSRVLG